MSVRVYADERVALNRDAAGVIHVRAEREADLYRGLGLAHGLDRALQLVIMRTLGQGRAAALLDASLVEVDRFFRKMRWTHGADVDALSESARQLADAYAAGVNRAMEKSFPWEAKVLGLSWEPWTVADSILIARMTGYLTMAQSQGEIERLFLQMVQAGVDDARLEALFPGRLAGLDRALIEKVELVERIVPAHVPWAPRVMASNNWVVSGKRTASGKPILCNDPHLEVNRLPAVWYEVALETPDRWALSGTMPGLPGLLIGRTTDLAWGATYTFADCIDSWVEHVRDGKVRRGDDWVDLTRRVETIQKKGGGSEEAVFYDTKNHGVLEGEPTGEKHLLATRWSGSATGARSIEAILGMWSARTVEEGMARLGRLETAFNWVLADATGRIAYQMSGAIPIRKDGARGFVPLPGWDADNDWRGFYEPEQLPREIDPERGYIVTANDDLNHLGEVDPINMSMGAYRAERIAELIEAAERITSEDMRRIQMDVYSRQAERFMAHVRPHLSETPDGRALASWDLRYDADSLGADPFERFYEELRRQVFGPVIGDGVVDFLSRETGLFTDFYSAFDEVLLAERSPWFGDRTREAVFAAAAERALVATPKRWGARQSFVMRHVLFGEKLPLFLGFDRGPYTLIGGRATPHQGQLYRSADRATSFAPSFRFVTDMAEAGWHSNLAGGPSDRRFSPWYVSEIEDWAHGRLKRVRPTSDT